MSVLLLDNRDSFVWNLAQAFLALGAECTVLRSDRVSLAEVVARRPGHIVLSPGPGRPEDAGICVDVVRELSGRVPLLGVCLGHQAIATAFGGRVDRGEPCHGKPWAIHHERTGLFRGVASPMQACRYHSLLVDASGLPGCLRAVATTPEGELMALEHRQHPTFGLQFHPESFRSDHGPEMLRNFLEVAA